jgi:hypothetical protein
MPGPSVAEGLPHRHEVRVLLEQLVLEPPEGSLSSDGTAQPAPSGVISNPLGEVSHVGVPNRRGEGIDRHQIQLIEVDRVRPIDAGVRCPEGQLSGARVDQP